MIILGHTIPFLDLKWKRSTDFFTPRTRSGVEVDFIVYGAKGIFAIEVKNSSRIQPQDIKSLRSFKEDYPESKAYLLYRGKERLMKNGVRCVPCDDFLRALRPGALF